MGLAASGFTGDFGELRELRLPVRRRDAALFFEDFLARDGTLLNRNPRMGLVMTSLTRRDSRELQAAGARALEFSAMASSA
jgi:deoxyribodipyrimidine photolyase-like uncharacterized protein